MRRPALAAVLLLAAGCHRSTAEVTLDTDADARNATEAKINADLAAADAAARAPMSRAPRVAPPAAAAPDPVPPEEPADNGAD